jgi:hypothetical protein
MPRIFNATQMIGMMDGNHRAYRIMPDERNKPKLKTNMRFVELLDGEVVWVDHERERVKIVELNKQFLEMKFYVFPFVTFEQAIRERRLNGFEIQGFVKEGIVKDWHTVGQNCVSWDAIDNGRWIVRYDQSSRETEEDFEDSDDLDI